MYHYVSSFFWRRPEIPEAPLMPSPFEIELRNAKLKHIQLGRNKPKFSQTQRQVVKTHLDEILRVKKSLNKVSVNKGKTYLWIPRHPVLAELLTTVAVIN